MEIKTNKEIRGYQESIFFGLNMRQCCCSTAAIILAVFLYFFSKNLVGQEAASWICIVGAAPIGVAGFFSYNGLPLEKYIIAVIKTKFLLSGRRLYYSENILYQAVKGGKKYD